MFFPNRPRDASTAGSRGAIGGIVVPASLLSGGSGDPTLPRDGLNSDSEPAAIFGEGGRPRQFRAAHAEEDRVGCLSPLLVRATSFSAAGWSVNIRTTRPFLFSFPSFYPTYPLRAGYRKERTAKEGSSLYSAFLVCFPFFSFLFRPPALTRSRLYGAAGCLNMFFIYPVFQPQIGRDTRGKLTEGRMSRERESAKKKKKKKKRGEGE